MRKESSLTLPSLLLKLEKVDMRRRQPPPPARDVTDLVGPIVRRNERVISGKALFDVMEDPTIEGSVRCVWNSTISSERRRRHG